MVNVLEIIGLVLMLVMIVSGVIGIIITIWYMKVFLPILKPMMTFYSKMIIRAEQEMEDMEA